MKLIINTSMNRFGGAVQVALSFINECKKYSDNEYHIVLGPGVKKSISRSSFPKNFFFYEVEFGKVYLWKIPLIQQKLSALEKRIQPDCIIKTSGPSYWHSVAPQIMGFTLPLYIYTDSPYLERMNLRRRLRWHIKRLLHSYFFKRDASAIVVQTDDVNLRVKKLLHINEVYTVTNTHNSFYYNWNEYPPKLPLRKKGIIRLITISAYYLHKDLEIIPKVSLELKRRGIQNIEFILTLDEIDFDNKIKITDNENIINVGPIKPEECPSLYDECDILFMPTLAECFSATYPEAMVMEKPIITTDLGFARSICGEAALFYKPCDPVSAADVIESLIKNKHLWNKLVAEGKEQLKQFDTPAMRAKKYLQLCEELIRKNKTSRPGNTIPLKNQL